MPAVRTSTMWSFTTTAPRPVTSYSSFGYPNEPLALMEMVAISPVRYRTTIPWLNSPVSWATTVSGSAAMNQLQMSTKCVPSHNMGPCE